MNRRNPVARPLAALVLALALVPAMAEAQTNIKPGFNLFAPEQDVQIGQESAQAAEQQLPILNDSQIEGYVSTIGQRLAANAGGPNFQYRFRVVNSTDINAFALPGGFIYVNRGVLEQARNEGEVAGVLAHEIAHVALRHGTHQASKAYAAQAGISILGGILTGGKSGGAADIINTVGGLGLNALFLKYSRDLESQADVRGAQILAATGYSPQDMISFFQTLEKVDTSKKTSWLSDHPAPPDRINRITKEAAMLRVSANPTTNVAQLQQVQARLRGAGGARAIGEVAQTNPNGRSRTSSSTARSTTATSVNVEAPASAMKTYVAPSRVYQVSYPANWQVYQEGSTGATIAPNGGVGSVGGRTEVVYGAIINHYDPFGSQQSAAQRNLRGATSPNVYGGNISLQDATNDLIGQIQQGSPHLKAISNSGQRFNLDGGTALAMSLRGTNPNTRINERVTVVTRQLADDHLIYMLFITPESEASRYAPVLQSMVSSLRFNDQQGH